MGVIRVPNDPEWFITTVSRKDPEKVLFKDIFKQRNEILSMMILWDYNSYYVNILDRYFIINGGRRLQPTVLLQLENPIVCYARRVQQDYAVNSGEMVEQ